MLDSHHRVNMSQLPGVPWTITMDALQFLSEFGRRLVETTGDV